MQPGVGAGVAGVPSTRGQWHHHLGGPGLATAPLPLTAPDTGRATHRRLRSQDHTGRQPGDEMR